MSDFISDMRSFHCGFIQQAHIFFFNKAEISQTGFMYVIHLLT